MPDCVFAFLCHAANLKIGNSRNGKSPQQQQSQNSQNSQHSQNSQDSNPFDNEDEEWEDDNALKDTGEPGVPVKALYDYDGAESDELTFKIGTLTFVKIVSFFDSFNFVQVRCLRSWKTKMSRAGVKAGKTAVSASTRPTTWSQCRKYAEWLMD